MATIPAELVKKLRERTGLGWMDCKRALTEAGGDIAKAEELLRKEGLKAADLRSGRATREGRIGHYVHSNGKIGVLVELNCETDFAAKSADFEQLLKDLCMQIAAQRPIYVAAENVPADLVRKEKEILTAQIKDKPAQMIEKIAEGKIKDFFKNVCLMEQPFIKEPAHSVRDRVAAANAKLGENLVVRRFVRFEVGEEDLISMAARPKYRRVLLKLSGEAFGRDDAHGLQLESLRAIARQIAAIHRSKIQLAVVIGGGNIVRGKSLSKAGITPVAADTMGMIATVINGVALQDVLETLGVDTRLQTAFPMQAIAEPYIRRRCIRHLEKGRVVILSAGTGSPHFTTDTAAALRAREIGAEVLLKATNVDGVYSADPKKHPDAKRFFRLTYDRVIHDKLQVMDATAITLCREGNVPIIVFNMSVPNNIRRAIAGRDVGTYIGEK